MKLLMHRVSLERQLVLVFAVVALFMGGYEFLKEWIFQGRLSSWQSHLITILVTAALAAAASAYTRQWLLLLQAKLNETRAVSKFNKTLLYATPSPMAVYSNDGQCVDANDAFVSLVGTSRGWLVEQHDISIWKEVGLEADFRQVQMTGNALSRELQDATMFGKEMWIEYLITPIHDADGHLLIQFTDLTTAKRLELGLRHLAFHDTLTNLPNRRLFFDRLEHALLNRKRSGARLAVLFIDLNRFKQVNDTHGHEAGDQMLIEASRRMQQVLRVSDTVARVGGDEFVVLLEMPNDADSAVWDSVSIVSDKIRQALVAPYQLGAITYMGSASIGIKIVTDNDATADEILQYADAAMYRDKQRHTAGA
ncbi:MAG: sensor domain-containing diguanylate cyclase [Burkholderiaceae bacterium]|nr:sensor domain-containing diguanylate cyclase [Roseateles sp.]MBV8469557.1 sensor domain-containing diguanylate cyclase [Burkholderiaceae bacterium]